MATACVINQQALIETGLFQEWSSETFNKLKNIDVSHKIPLDAVAESMGEYLRTNGLNSELGITRTHNHFKLNPGEVVQLTLGSSIDEPSIKASSEATVAHLSPIELNNTDTMPIPYMWAYNKASKQFFAMQFFDGSNTTMQRRFNELCGEKRDKLVAFLVHFIDKVEKTSTEDDLGFYIRYEDLMKLDSENGEGLLEDTDISGRRQWMTPKTKEMLQAILSEKQKIQPDYKISMTHWFFNDTIGSMQNDYHSCCHCCCHK
ncbi:unnamed protein product [Rotaria magnacalcarata]|uniref:Uncharacterized protein n=1 Tax=Rotaria magnacalcarata TaxID=392030 RepID=A0A816ZAL9_9BILA|nr:unnamed protein product [Rotaria magnacalcarata]CAF2186809.1 unnamed protein product [Rotaria magnacalcarata]